MRLQYCISKRTSGWTLNMWLLLFLSHYAHMEFATVFPFLKICLEGTDLCVSIRAFSSSGNCPFHCDMKQYQRIPYFSHFFGKKYCNDALFGFITLKEVKLLQIQLLFLSSLQNTRSSLMSKQGVLFNKWKSSSLHYKSNILKKAWVLGEQFTA